MTINRVWILGASDPEMEMIEELLRACGEEVIHALDDRGERVHPGNAYRCPTPEVPDGATVYAVECIDTLPEGWVRIDHHRPGDPGYGRSPEEFLPASSIGQVIAELARLGRLPPAPRQAGGISSSIYDDGWDRGFPSWVPWQRGHQLSVGTPGQWVLRGYRGLWAVGEAVESPRHYLVAYVPTDFILAAAADHCLAHAYAGECPGVNPDALMRWRVEQRARFQGRSVDDVLADVEAAREVLWEVPLVELSASLVGSHAVVYDLRGRDFPELPEAAAREGVAYLATVTERDGRRKVVLGGHTTPAVVRAFMEHWAPAHGLMDIYGDPARGFAGAYMPEAG